MFSKRPREVVFLVALAGGGDKMGCNGETIGGAIIIPRLSRPSLFDAILPLQELVAMLLN
jgi:hypothetical protein